MPNWKVLAEVDQRALVSFSGHLERQYIGLLHDVVLSLAAIRPGPVIIDQSQLTGAHVSTGAVLLQMLRYIPLQSRRFIWCGSAANDGAAQLQSTAMASRMGVCWEFEPDVTTALAMIATPPPRAVFHAVTATTC